VHPGAAKNNEGLPRKPKRGAAPVDNQQKRQYLFTFAAKSIQEYVLAGGKLRDMVGGTTLIDELASEEMLRTWLKGPFGLDEQDFSVKQAAAGQARILFHNEVAAKRVSTAWPLWCDAWAPGLEVVQDLAELGSSYTEALNTSSSGLAVARQRPSPQLPEAGPMTQRAPRTGRAAVARDKRTGELVDIGLARKRARRDADRIEGNRIATHFDLDNKIQLPNEFSELVGENKLGMAVIHADGNRLGSMFKRVGKSLRDADADDHLAQQVMNYLSRDVVGSGTEAAVKSAVQKLRKDGLIDTSKLPWPITPIVLAGDDLTVACRAELGLPFTENFLDAFAHEMEERLGATRETSWKNLPDGVKEAIPEGLSAGAGIVFCAPNYPFSLAYELCESLASEAKTAAKASCGPTEIPPSAVSFARVAGGSAPTDVQGLRDSVQKGSDGTVLSGCPYFINTHMKPDLADLNAVVELIAAPGSMRFPSSKLRDLVTLQRRDAARVPDAVDRMLEIVGEKRRVGFSCRWKLLCNLGDKNWSESGWKALRFNPDSERDRCSPLLDVLTIAAMVGAGTEGENNESAEDELGTDGST